MSVGYGKRTDIYLVTFVPFEKVTVCNTISGLGLEGDTLPNVFPIKWIENVEIPQNMFLFISDHSRENFVIDIDRDVECDPPKTVLKKVTLIYG